MLQLLRPHAPQIAIITLLMMLAAVVWAVIPLSAQVFFDHGLFGPHGSNIRLVSWLTVGVIAAAALAAAVQSLHGYLAERMGQQIVQQLRDSLYEHLQQLSLGFFSDTRTGEIQSRLTTDVAQIQDAVGRGAPGIGAATVSALAVAGAMLVLSAQLTVVSLALLPVMAWLSLLVSRQQRTYILAIAQGKASITVLAEETLSPQGALLTRVFGRQQLNLRRFRQVSSALSAAQLRSLVYFNILSTAMLAVFTAAPALLYLTSAVGGRYTAGTLVAFTALQFRLFEPVSDMINVVTHLRSTLPVFDRVFEFSDIAPAIADRPGATQLARAAVRGDLELTGVCFRYRARTEPGRPDAAALRGVSLRVRAGQFAALVGPSGSGKTTLSLLIPRLYEPDSGTVTIDGQDVRGLTAASLAQAIGFVTQETCLLHASVADNLRYGRPDATEQEMEAACRAAQIHHRITQLPGGYQASVGERGQRLSGGERQRLAIARTILKDPPVLILDEATSALDAASERQVQAALDVLMAGRTTIAIAHRLSTIRRADIIFVLAEGLLTEQGTHDELMARNGAYAGQFAREPGAGGQSAPDRAALGGPVIGATQLASR